MEDSLQDREAFGIYQGKHFNYFPDSISTPKGLFLGRTFPAYFSFSRVLFNSSEKIIGRENQSITVRLSCKLDQSTLDRIHPQFDYACVWIAVYEKDEDEPIVLPTDLTLKNITSLEQEVTATVELPIPKGNYRVRFGISSCVDNWPTINSSVTQMRIQ